MDATYLPHPKRSSWRNVWSPRNGKMTHAAPARKQETILVIGGGIAGITAAVELAEVGLNVILLEREPFLGGRVLRSHRYFPKLCPPTCGLEVNFRRIRENPRIRVHTLAEIVNVSGRRGAYDVTVRTRPRYISESQRITQHHLEAVETRVSNDFNLGMDRVRALRLPHDMTFPSLHVLDREELSEAERSQLADSEPRGCIDLEQVPGLVEFRVEAIIVATGWRPYDATQIEPLGYGALEDVVLNVQLERMAAANGPTGGRILRPSDGREPASVAFAQCAGSRDPDHLPYCSTVCCMASLKQARYVREALPQADVSIFYVDIRTIGRHERFHQDLLVDGKVSFVRGRVAGVQRDGEALEVEVRETVDGRALRARFDLVVLAVGIVPNHADAPLPGVVLETDEFGFIVGAPDDHGIFSVGCASRPADVSWSVKSATAAALRAIRYVRRER
jgi:quinone-modifying oxidoreductase subunit QmoA